MIQITKMAGARPRQVSNYLFRMVALLAVVLYGSIVGKAEVLNLDDKSIPYENWEYASLSELSFSFNYDNLDLSEYAPEDLGLAAAMTSKKKIVLYKGDETSGEEIFTFRKISFDYTTGVEEIADCPFDLSKNGSHVIISGLNEDDAITIYTVGGMKMADLPAVPADMHEASIALPEGQVYIIVINGVSIKYKH